MQHHPLKYMNCKTDFAIALKEEKKKYKTKKIAN